MQLVEIQTEIEEAQAPPQSPHRLTWGCGLLAAVIILAGLPFRFELAEQIFLDFDEAMYFQAAKEPSLAGVWEASQIHTHPPLAFMVYHLWLKVGTSEWLLRLPSVLLGLAAAWFGYAWLARVTDRRAALVGVFVLTFSMPVVHVSAQMRSYTLLFAFVFAALWCHERFRESGAIRYVVCEVLALSLALLTHYATAWIIGVLGVSGLLLAIQRGLRSTASRTWVVSQLVLFGVCVWLYFAHIRSFVGSSTQTGLWEFWLHGNTFGDSLGGRIAFTFVSGMQFFSVVFGKLWWCPALFLTLTGACVLAMESRSDSASVLPVVERALLVLLPFVFAFGLHVARVYPFGPTRHSLWLMPFAMLGISSAVRPLLARPRLAWRLGVATTCLFWAWLYPYRSMAHMKTTLTPELMRRTVVQIKASIRPDELILTDDGTRNVLAYYLGQDSVDRGRDLAHGFREYRLGGFRIVTIPKFHFFQYSLREDWSSFVSTLGEETTQPLWVVYMGFESPGNDLKSIGRRLPPAKLLARHTIGDNQLVRVQFREPQGLPANDPAGGSVNPAVQLPNGTNRVGANKS